MIYRRTGTTNARPQLIFPNRIECIKVATGAVLTQFDLNGVRHPVAFLSQTFTDIEKQYEIYDWELLGII